MTEKPDIASLLPDDARLAARRRALEAELGPGRRTPRHASRRVVIAVLALLALGGGGAWAAGVFSAEDIAFNAGVGCYEQPSLHGSAAIFHSAANPVAKCARVWREGALGLRLKRLESEGKIDRRPGRYSPHLVACTGQNRPVLVFPGPDGLCARLGLEPLPGDYAAVGRPHARAFAAVHKVGELVPATSECPSPSGAVARARTRLPERYADIEVTIDGREPCAREYQALGGKIVVVTMSRGLARQERNGERISSALLGLLERVTWRCLPADYVRLAARRHLARAGLEEVTVRVVEKGPCVIGQWGAHPENAWKYHPENAEVELVARARRVWAASRPSR